MVQQTSEAREKDQQDVIDDLRKENKLVTKGRDNFTALFRKERDEKNVLMLNILNVKD